MDSAWSAWAITKINDTCQHPVPYLGSNDIQERNLAKWYQMMKGKFSRGSLNDEEINRLAALPGWTWAKKKDTEFSRKARLWSKWYLLHGSQPTVSKNSSKEERNLAQWASRYQKLYSQDKLDARQIEAFKSVDGWKWRDSNSKSHISFEQRMNSWIAFVQKYERPPTDGPLYQWRKRMTKLFSENKLSDGKQHQLLNLPLWSWDDVENDYVKMGKRWSSWVRLNQGVFPSPFSTTNHVEQKLGEWAYQMKQVVQNGEIPIEIIESFNKLYKWREFCNAQ